MKKIYEKKIELILLECGVEEDKLHCKDFISEEILDSLTMAEIIITIEEIFHVEIDVEELIPENFVNITTISALIERYLRSDTRRED